MVKIIVEGDRAKRIALATKCYEPTVPFIVDKGDSVNIEVGPDSKKLILIGDITDSVDCNVPDNASDPVDTDTPQVVTDSCIAGISVGSSNLLICKDGGELSPKSPAVYMSTGDYVAESITNLNIDA